MKNLHFAKFAWVTMLMVVSLYFIPVLLMAQAKPATPASSTYTDSRDSQVYNWVKVGNQVWMTDNLRFNVPAGSWAYNNDSVNLPTFGRLYTWKSAQTACPKGWHLASDKEWNVLIQSLGGSNEAGMKIQTMDTIGKFAETGKPAAISGSSKLLTGVRHPDGSCIGINLWGGCWIAGKVKDTVGSNILFAHGTKDVTISTNDKNAGFAVRCIRNK
jgi:uncharacterized protein (TIGR02145 family)